MIRRSIKRSIKRKSIKRRSIKRRSNKRRLNKIYDGMDSPTDSIPTIDNPIDSIPTKIKLENYIDDIKLFNDESFIETICFFRVFKSNEIKNDTFDFIKELFNFDRNENINLFIGRLK